MKRLIHIIALLTLIGRVSGQSFPASKTQLELSCFSGEVYTKDCGNCGSSNNDQRFYAKGLKIRNKAQKRDYYVLDPVVGYARGNYIQLVGGPDQDGNPTGFSFNRSQVGITFDSLNTLLQECQCCSLIGGGGSSSTGDIVTGISIVGDQLRVITDLGTVTTTIDGSRIVTSAPITIGGNTYPTGTDIETVLNGVQSSLMQIDWYVSNDTAYFVDGAGNVYSYYLGSGSSGVTDVTKETIGGDCDSLIITKPSGTTKIPVDCPGASITIEANSGTYLDGDTVKISGEGANFRELTEPAYIGGDDAKITLGDNEGAFTNRLIFDNSTNPLRPNLRYNIGGGTTDRSFFYFDALGGQLGTTGSVIGDESLLNWLGTGITLTQKLDGGVTSLFRMRGDTMYMNSNPNTDLTRIPQIGDPNSIWQVNNRTRISMINGGEIWTPKVLAGTARTGQAFVYNESDNSVELQDVARESMSIDTVNQASFGFNIGSGVTKLALSSYIQTPAGETPDAFVLDSLDGDNYVVMFSGEIDIASLSSAAQTYWDGLTNVVRYWTDSGTSETPDYIVRPLHKRAFGSVMAPNFFGFDNTGGQNSDPFIFDSQGGTTDANGYVSISHSLGVPPSSAVATVFNSNANTMYSVMVTGMSGTSLNLRIWDDVADAALSSTFIVVNYFIK